MQITSQLKVYLLVALSLAIGAYCHAHLLAAGLHENIPSIESVPTARSLKVVSLGFDQILADYYWLKLVSCVGDVELQRTDRLSKAEHLVDLVSTLDPHFISVYWFAAFTIGGEQRNPKKAAEILEFGIQNNHDNWYLPFIAGVNQYLYAGNERAAASYYRVAAGFPGAPTWLSRQAQILETETPKLLKDANSWLNIFKSGENGPVRERAKEQCIRLWVQVYKVAPNYAYRERASKVLKELGVDVGSFRKTD